MIEFPYTILIDSAEQHPFTFENMLADSDKDYAPINVKVNWRSLGRHPNQLGDYSIDGFVGRVHIERKSVEDCQHTILGWDGTRNRFEQELANLSDIESGIVVVEGSLQEVVTTVRQWGEKTAQENAKTLFRSIIAYQQDYKVRWQFCDSRRLAENFAFRFLHRYWKKRRKEHKQLMEI